MARKVALSTIDNPFSPFRQEDQWRQFDVIHGYNSEGLLARITYVADGVDDELNVDEIERAIDNWVAIDPTNSYIKVVED